MAERGSEPLSGPEAEAAPRPTAEHWYRAYGLVVRSEIALPEFLPTAPAEPALDIRFGPEAARQWAGLGDGREEGEARTGIFHPAPEGGFVMRMPEVCDYWVRAGREIAVSPAPGVDAATVRLFLLGSALGMAFHQRGLLVLHGATILHGDGASIFVGDSGQGKSTLAAHLGRAGFAILGDDTMPLSPRRGGGFEVWPGSRMFKLWSDTIDHLGESSQGLESVGVRLDKYFFPNSAQPPDRPAPVCEIVELVTGDADGAAALTPLEGLEALGVISANTYRPHYVAKLGREADHFRLCAALADSIAVRRLSRPRAIERIGESLELLRERWPQPGRVAGGAA